MSKRKTVARPSDVTDITARAERLGRSIRSLIPKKWGFLVYLSDPDGHFAYSTDAQRGLLIRAFEHIIQRLKEGEI